MAAIKILVGTVYSSSLAPAPETRIAQLTAASKKYLIAIVVVAGVLGLILLAGSHVLRDEDRARTTTGGSATKGKEVAPSMSAIENLPLVSSNRLLAARTRHSPSIEANTDGTGNNADARATEERKRKALLAYHDAVRCRDYAQAKRAVSVITKKMIPVIESEQDADGISNRLEELHQVLQRSNDQCEGISLEEIDASFFEITLRAARDGDLGAQGCFVQFGGRNQFEKPTRKEQYFTYAPHFMERGIEAAYWPTVYNAVKRLTAWWVDNQPQLMSLPEPDPKHVYRAVRLIYYRSEPEGTSALDKIMQLLQERYHLSPQEVDQADRWAQQQYAARFTNTPLLSPWSRMSYCQ